MNLGYIFKWGFQNVELELHFLVVHIIKVFNIHTFYHVLTKSMTTIFWCRPLFPTLFLAGGNSLKLGGGRWFSPIWLGLAHLCPFGFFKKKNHPLEMILNVDYVKIYNLFFLRLVVCLYMFFTVVSVGWTSGWQRPEMLWTHCQLSISWHDFSWPNPCSLVENEQS